jgi:hypothetical protein
MNTVGLHIDTVGDELTLLFEFFIFASEHFGETPLLGDNDSLFSGEFILGSSEGFHGVLQVAFNGSDGVKGLSDFDTGALFVGLTESTSHTGLETIGTGTGQHLVDTDDVPGVHAASHMEGVFTALLDHVFIGGHTGSFHGAGGNLFLLPGDHMDGESELVAKGFLSTDIVGSDLGVRATTAESRFRIRFVLGVAIASSRSSSHFRLCKTLLKSYGFEYT